MEDFREGNIFLRSFVCMLLEGGIRTTEETETGTERERNLGPKNSSGVKRRGYGHINQKTRVVLERFQ